MMKCDKNVTTCIGNYTITISIKINASAQWKPIVFLNQINYCRQKYVYVGKEKKNS